MQLVKQVSPTRGSGKEDILKNNQKTRAKRPPYRGLNPRVIQTKQDVQGFIESFGADSLASVFGAAQHTKKSQNREKPVRRQGALSAARSSKVRGQSTR